MDEQNLETKETITSSGPIVVPVPHHRKMAFLKPLLFIILLILVVVAGIWFYFYKIKPKNVPVVTSSPATALQLDNASATLPGGYPGDLVFDTSSPVVKDDISYSTDGKIVTVDRAYMSSLSLAVEYKFVEALTNKGWNVTEVSSSASAPGRTYTATKLNYSATITITSATNSPGTIVDTTVQYQSL